jgi:hypothetical protein
MEGSHIPFAKPFLVKIEHLEYVESADHTKPRPSFPPDFLWRPSQDDRYATRSSESWRCDLDVSSSLSYYRPVRFQPAPDFNHYEPYKSCTMIWDTEWQQYLHLPIDCTQQARLPPSEDWLRLSFGHHPARQHIALVGSRRESHQLHQRGPSYWFPDLLPHAYQSPLIGAEPCGLAGNLSILLGLVAFSAAPEQVGAALNESFRPAYWSTVFNRHGYSIWPGESSAPVAGTREVEITCANAPSYVQDNRDDVWSSKSDMIRPSSIAMSSRSGNKANTGLSLHKRPTIRYSPATQKKTEHVAVGAVLGRVAQGLPVRDASPATTSTSIHSSAPSLPKPFVSRNRSYP